MTPFVNMVILTLSLPVFTSSHISPSVILFMCFTKSASKNVFVIISAGFSSLLIYLTLMSLSYTMYLRKWRRISKCLARIPTWLFYLGKLLLDYPRTQLIASVLMGFLQVTYLWTSRLVRMLIAPSILTLCWSTVQSSDYLTNTLVVSIQVSRLYFWHSFLSPFLWHNYN